MRFLRRLRGALGIAATWGAAFAGFGAIMSGVMAVVLAVRGITPSGPGMNSLVEAVVTGITRWATVGVTSGLLFSVALAAAEGGRTLDALSPRRFKRWGILAGALGSSGAALVIVVSALKAGLVSIPAAAIAGDLAATMVIGGLLGRATAKAILDAARRGPALEAGADALPLAPGTHS